MEIREEYHTTQKTLFRRVNQIRNANGLCMFEEEGPGYRLQYCDDVDLEYVFIVLKGKDGKPFTLYDEFCECHINLQEGDVIVYECEENNKVWFSIPSITGNAQEDTEDTEETVGYAEYGTIAEMVEAGFIINTKKQNLSLHAFLREVRQEPEISQTKEVKKEIEAAMPAISPSSETVKQEPAIFELLARLLQSDDLKSALDKIRHIAEFCDRKKGCCIKNHHVMYRWYYTGYSFFKGFQYTQAAQMRFGGRWLERAGFTTGRQAKIITIKDMVLIVPVHLPETG